MYISIDGLDSLVLSRIQGDFPISEDPYGDIGLALGVSAQEVLFRVRRLVENGVVRKVGPFFNPMKMGHFSTLCALDVPDEKVEKVASLISSYPEVTSNYLRSGTPNLWFTVFAGSTAAIGKLTGEIEEKGAVRPVRNLPAIRMFKVRLGLKAGE
jgi:DNA-binding Lrp family transcriptional regulator